MEERKKDSSKKPTSKARLSRQAKDREEKAQQRELKRYKHLYDVLVKPREDAVAQRLESAKARLDEMRKLKAEKAAERVERCERIRAEMGAKFGEAN